MPWRQPNGKGDSRQSSTRDVAPKLNTVHSYRHYGVPTHLQHELQAGAPPHWRAHQRPRCLHAALRGCARPEGRCSHGEAQTWSGDASLQHAGSEVVSGQA